MTTATPTIFKIETVDVSSTSPALAPLAGRQYNSEYTALPNANLPKLLRSQLNTIFATLTGGEELPLDENTFLIKAASGVYSRLFGPVLKVGAESVEGTIAGELYIQWGPRFMPITLVKGGFALPDGTPLDAEFSSYNFSGRGEDPALFINVVGTSGTELSMPICVRFTDWENAPEAKVLNSMLKKKPEDIVPLLQVAAPKGSGNRIQADSDVDLRDLEIGTPFEVVGYYPCKTSYGQTYRVLINNFPGEGLVAAAWAHSSIKPLLSTEPEISKEKPATLVVRSREEMPDGKIRMRVTLLLSAQEMDDSALDLDF